MNDRYSPGPWRVENERDIVDARGEMVAIASPFPERQADARLIAAAPELLEALEGVLAEEDPRARTIARALIRRIEGS